jgi:hypothetical protein
MHELALLREAELRAENESLRAQLRLREQQLLDNKSDSQTAQADRTGSPRWLSGSLVVQPFSRARPTRPSRGPASPCARVYRMLTYFSAQAQCSQRLENISG